MPQSSDALCYYESPNLCCLSTESMLLSWVLKLPQATSLSVSGSKWVTLRPHYSHPVQKQLLFYKLLLLQQFSDLSYGG